MELIIVKNGHIFARATDNDTVEADIFELREETVIPDFPAEEPGKGKYWDLDYDEDGALVWVLKDRPLTQEERMEELEERMYDAEFQPFIQPTGAHDAYPLGAKVKFNNRHYISLLDANVWSPEEYPQGWEEAL
ncbi:MAG: hypothetical protein MJ078_05940 [Clostridia bacterium]|nr:hypothetical protein [Clostridia bacterium]